MARNAKFDPEADLRRIVLDRLKTQSAAQAPGLEALPTSRLLSLYFNWSSRFIPVRRRQVFRSRELGDNAEYAKHRDDIERLLAKITVGADLTPHLSTRIDVAYEVDKGAG